MTSYLWFQGASVDGLAAALARYPGCRLEVHPNAEHPEKSMLIVVPSGSTSPDAALAFNEAHPCPPQCP